MPPLALTDSQIRAVMATAAALDPDKRALLLERVAAHLRCNGVGRPNDYDFGRALTRALQGLQQQGHDAA